MRQYYALFSTVKSRTDAIQLLNKLKTIDFLSSLESFGAQLLHRSAKTTIRLETRRDVSMVFFYNNNITPFCLVRRPSHARDGNTFGVSGWPVTVLSTREHTASVSSTQSAYTWRGTRKKTHKKSETAPDFRFKNTVHSTFKTVQFDHRGDKQLFPRRKKCTKKKNFFLGFILRTLKSARRGTVSYR